MLSPADIAVIVPVYRMPEQPERARALARVLSLLDAAGLRPVLARDDGAAWNKGKTVNAAVAERSAHPSLLPAWLWIHDADVELPFVGVLAAVDPTGPPLVQPFRKIVRLDAEQTEARLRGERVKLPLTSAPACDTFGGGSLIVRTDVYLRSRGFDERFTGWGSEDVEFGERLVALAGPPAVIDVRGLHMWHPLVPKSAWAKTRAANRALLEASRIGLAQGAERYIRQAVESIIPVKPAGGLVSPSAHRIIQIDITNACHNRCSNCSRFCGHFREPFYMTPERFGEAVSSLDTYPGMVGMMGGEPTLHPDFAALVDHLAARRPDPDPGPRQYAPCIDWGDQFRDVLSWSPWRKGLWTALGPGYRRHYGLIQRTFRYQCVNDHRGGGRHMALLLPRKDLGISDAEWLPYRNACWLQRNWSASVRPRGAYFCEVAGALSDLLGGCDGWKLEPEWWRRGPTDFGDQLELCEWCSACLPVPSLRDGEATDQVTAAMAERLTALGSRKALAVVPETWPQLKARYETREGTEPYLEGSDHVRVHHPSGVEVGRVAGVLVCIGYDDYLALTLPRMVQELDRVIVATRADDERTRRVIRDTGATECLAEALADGMLRKGAALNEATARLAADAWVAYLDADILVPRGWGDNLRMLVLNPDALYYGERRGPPLHEWRMARPVAEQALASDDWAGVWETIGDRCYVQAQPWGYCQVVNLGASALRGRPDRYPAEWQSAQGDDSTLADQWYGRECCVPLPACMGPLLHLPHGPARQNWHGRVSPRLDDDTWWAADPRLLWRVSYRAGPAFAGLWQLCQAITDSLPPGAIVEIGTMLGDGAAVLAAAFPERRVITVDPGPTPEVQAEAAKRCALWPNVERWACTGAEAADRAHREGIGVALAYLDGDHEEPGVRADIVAWRALLVPAGCLAGHDYADPAYPGVRAAVDGTLGTPYVYAGGSWLARADTDRGTP